MLTHKRLKELFYYDPGLGTLVRRVTQGGVFAGTPVFNRGNQEGLIQLKIDRKTFCLHKIIWFYFKKKYPLSEIDHIDTNRKNNRIENLRRATGSNNCANQKCRANNKLGVKGVHQRESGRYRACIMKKGKTYRLGTFATLKEAQTAYAAAAKKLFGQFARTH